MFLAFVLDVLDVFFFFVMILRTLYLVSRRLGVPSGTGLGVASQIF